MRRVLAEGNGASDGAVAHNLYAPFYKAYIPAANRSGTSGVAGTFGNNFPGFVTDGRPYDYWDTLLQETYTNPANTCRNPLGQIYHGSSGIRGVTLYTDEHGEAWAMYDPNVNPLTGGFDLPETYAGTSNVQCDVSPGVAGVETISARGFYPEQPALGIPFDKSLTKTVYHEGSKTLTCVNKPGGDPNDGAVCTETITDLAGNPLNGAPVPIQRVATWQRRDLPGREPGRVPDYNQSLRLQTGAGTDGPGTGVSACYDSHGACLNIVADNLGTHRLGSPQLGLPASDVVCGVRVGERQDRCLVRHPARC